MTKFNRRRPCVQTDHATSSIGSLEETQHQGGHRESHACNCRAALPPVCQETEARERESDHDKQNDPTVEAVNKASRRNGVVQGAENTALGYEGHEDRTQHDRHGDEEDHAQGRHRPRIASESSEPVEHVVSLCRREPDRRRRSMPRRRPQ